MGGLWECGGEATQGIPTLPASSRAPHSFSSFWKEGPSMSVFHPHGQMAPVPVPFLAVLWVTNCDDNSSVC